MDGIPVLLGPEAYVRRACLPSLSLPQYREAYAEMPVYNQVALERSDPRQQSHQRSWLTAASRLSVDERNRFPCPSAVWCDQLYEYEAQYAAYKKLAPLAGTRVLQVGGTGIHALKFLLAGASEAWLVTPMQCEAEFTLQLAGELGLLANFHAVVAVGEELPFPASSFDRIFTSGCLHHMLTGMAAGEARRVLTPKGVFAAVDPWRAHLRRVGILLAGRRERGIHCRPLDRERLG
ncbi:MAG: class I SAM-dependent methyltransferase, partial [Terriglobales bacterium]